MWTKSPVKFFNRSIIHPIPWECSPSDVFKNIACQSKYHKLTIKTKRMSRFQYRTAIDNSSQKNQTTLNYWEASMRDLCYCAARVTTNSTFRKTGTCIDSTRLSNIKLWSLVNILKLYKYILLEKAIFGQKQRDKSHNSKRPSTAISRWRNKAHVEHSEQVLSVWQKK